MKLSFKFFAIAYGIVLPTTGMVGMFLVRHISDTLWDARVQTVSNAEGYAIDSFMAYSEMQLGRMTKAQCDRLAHQILATLDSAIARVEIVSDAQSDAEGVNKGRTVFTEQDERLIMDVSCRVAVGTDNYVVRVSSDLTELHEQRRDLWRNYSVTILTLSILSGLVIYRLTKTVTRPLRTLTASARRIAEGEYDARVSVSGRDEEIAALSESFNHMAETVEETIDAITQEVENREAFVANFAHEMKTPMTSIVGYAQMLSCYELSEEERRTAAETIRREASRLETLSLQMLEWSVYRRGGAELKSIALSDVAQSLQQTLEAVSRKYRIPFCVRLDDVGVEADPVLLMSLLYNLADNAFKASQSSEVTVYSTVCGDRVTLCVKDRGRGIARENIEKLTEAFYREDRSRSRALGGAGLGLFICQQIASLHGTTLRFDSVLGAGTEVSFELKRAGETDV